MKDEKWIRWQIETYIKNIIRMCPHIPINLKSYYQWTAISVLCEVLEVDSCEFWNEIVEACPFYGDVTECSELS